MKPACQPPAIPVNTHANPANVMMNGQQVMPQTNGQYDEDMGYRLVAAGARIKEESDKIVGGGGGGNDFEENEIMWALHFHFLEANLRVW